jgi:pyruvate-formate lyase-activating enzyme
MIPAAIPAAPFFYIAMPSKQFRSLKAGGITPFTATDFPGQLAAVIFVQGCPWRCGYCHNPHLQTRTAESPIAWADVMALLRRRTGLVDAIVFSALGFKIGLHSGGTHPARLKQVLPLVDWIGLDIKANFDDYDAITRVRNSGAPALASLHAVLESGVSHECRSTIHPSLHSEAQIEQLARRLAGMGIRHYALQVFRPTGCADENLNSARQAGFPSAALIERITPLFESFTLRKH